MDPDSGRIYDAEQMKRLDAATQKRLVEIPPGQLCAVLGMNHKQRRTWAAQQRKQKAKDRLETRTKLREERGVEGTNVA